MSQSRHATWIDCVANELGIENLDRKIVSDLENSIKHEIQQILQDSIKFAKHSYRKNLLPSDIHCTLNMRNSPPIIGCNHNSTQFYDPHSDSKQDPNKPNSNIMIKHDEYITLKDLERKPLTKPPKISVIVSWLAINGTVLGGANNSKHLFNRIPKKTNTKHSSNKPKIEIKPITCHDISKEQQLFFEVLRNTVVRGDMDKLNIFLDILQNADAGLARLVPRIVQFIAKSVSDNVNDINAINLSFLYSLMRIAEALILSRYLSCYLENYLQQFMPPILTCAMKENLSQSPTENHWNLRNKSAQIVQLVLDKFGKKFPMVRSKVIRTLIGYFNDFTKTFKTHYGAIVTMKCLGIDALESGLLANIERYIAIKLKPILEGNVGNNSMQRSIKQNVIKQYEAKMVQSVILESLWLCSQHQQNQDLNAFNQEKNKKILMIHKQLQETFGEALIPFNPTPPGCDNCFI